VFFFASNLYQESKTIDAMSKKIEKNKSYILSDETLNSYGIVIETKGIDLSYFLQNPTMLKEHAWSIDNVIGKWTNIVLEGAKLVAEPIFDIEIEEAAKIAGQVERGFVNAVSIGGRILEAKEMKDKDGNAYLLVTKFLLLEASFVVIPSNKSCLRIYNEKHELIENFTFADFVTKNTIKMDLDLKIVGKALGLSESATEVEVLAEIAKAKAAQSDLVKFQQEQKTLQKAQIEKMCDERALTPELKAQFVKFGEMDYAGTKLAIEGIVLPKTEEAPQQVLTLKGIVESYQGGASGNSGATVRGDWDFEKWSKEDPEGLTKLGAKKIDVLYKAQYGTSITEDNAKVNFDPMEV
jgi:hypothetical protein